MPIDQIFLFFLASILWGCQGPGNEQAEQAILGGKIVSPSAHAKNYGFMVAITLKGSTQVKCGGSLVAPNLVVTAAHCFAKRPEEPELDLHCGSPFIGGGQTRQNKKVIQHENFRDENPANYNDVSVVVLKTPFDINESCYLINLPKDPDKCAQENIGINLGWGSTTRKIERLSQQLVEVINQTIQPTCRLTSKYYEDPYDFVICTLPKGLESTCTGDSGGPLFLKSGHEAELVGVLSWGPKDCIGDSIFMNFCYFLDFLKDISEKESVGPVSDQLSSEDKVPSEDKEIRVVKEVDSFTKDSWMIIIIGSASMVGVLVQLAVLIEWGCAEKWLSGRAEK